MSVRRVDLSDEEEQMLARLTEHHRKAMLMPDWTDEDTLRSALHDQHREAFGSAVRERALEGQHHDG